MEEASKSLGVDSIASASSSAHSQNSEETAELKVKSTDLERYFQGMSCSYAKLTEMYAALQQEKAQEVEGWKR